MRNKRRQLLALVLGTVVGPRLQAQSSSRAPIVGVLRPGALREMDSSSQAMKQALAQAGYVDGSNFRLEQRFAQGRPEHLPKLAEELVRLNADIIIATNEASVRAAKQATQTIPIVMVAYDHDPVASGLIQSLRRPGGNITGVVARQTELAGKRLELLKEAVPAASQVAVLHDASRHRPLDELSPAAQALGLQLQATGLRARDDFAAAFRRAREAGSTAAVVLFSPMLHAERARVAQAALAAAMPTMSQERDFVQAGVMMSYAPDRDAILARVAYYVDRILKGDKVHDLPVEQADKFKLAVNLKTAKALGISIPQSILVRADEVIR